jgi:hypothetical protein
MTQHHFCTELADEVGVMKAILLDNIYYWWQRNVANQKNFHDGSYWTFNSSRAFLEMFSYMSRASITRYLFELERDGWLKSANYNKARYDRTKWYTLTEKSINIFNVSLNNNSPLPKVDNVLTQSEATIPYSKPDNKLTALSQSQLTLWFDAFWREYPVKRSKYATKKAFGKVVKSVEDFNFVCKQLTSFKKTQQWKEGIAALRTGSKCYIKHGSSWLNSGDYKDDLSEQQSSLAPPKVATDEHGLTPQQHHKFTISLLVPGEDFESCEESYQLLKRAGGLKSAIEKWKVKDGYIKPKKTGPTCPDINQE